MAKKMFKNTTLREKYCIYFEENAHVEVESRTNKYRVFKGPIFYYFVGRSGGVRANDRNAVNGSFSRSDSFKRMITDWAKQRDQKEKVEV